MSLKRKIKLAYNRIQEPWVFPSLALLSALSVAAFLSSSLALFLLCLPGFTISGFIAFYLVECRLWERLSRREGLHKMLDKEMKRKEGIKVKQFRELAIDALLVKEKIDAHGSIKETLGLWEPFEFAEETMTWVLQACRQLSAAEIELSRKKKLEGVENIEKQRDLIKSTVHKIEEATEDLKKTFKLISNAIENEEKRALEETELSSLDIPPRPSFNASKEEAEALQSAFAQVDALKNSALKSS